MMFFIDTITTKGNLLYLPYPPLHFVLHNLEPSADVT